MHKHFEIFKIRTGLVLTIQKRQTYGTNNQEIKKVRSIELSKPKPGKNKMVWGSSTLPVDEAFGRFCYLGSNERGQDNHYPTAIYNIPEKKSKKN